jgi:GT2 family glycosyltransferase
MSNIAVCIVNYNTREDLRACLQTILPEAPAQALVVDNASSDGSPEMVRTEFPDVLLDASDTNWGYGQAANRGISKIAGDYVLLLNSDTRLAPGALDSLRDYLDRRPRAALAGPRLRNFDSSLQPSCHQFPSPLITLLEYTLLGRAVSALPFARNWYLPAWAHDKPRVVPWVKGAALAIRRKAFDSVGGFDTSFFMYSEEMDLCFRLQAAGWEVHFAPLTDVVHLGETSTDQQRRAMKLHLYASTVHFCRRHYSRMRLIAHLAVLKSIMIIRLIRNLLPLLIVRSPIDHSRIKADVVVAWKILLSKWQKQ